MDRVFSSFLGAAFAIIVMSLMGAGTGRSTVEVSLPFQVSGTTVTLPASYTLQATTVQIPDDGKIVFGDGTWGWMVEHGKERTNFYTSAGEVPTGYVDFDAQYFTAGVGGMFAVTGNFSQIRNAAGTGSPRLPYSMLMNGVSSMPGGTPADGIIGVYPDTDTNILTIIDQAATEAAITHVAIDIVN